MSPQPDTVLSDVGEIIDALGGPSKLADKFGFMSFHAVKMWRARKMIPPAYRPTIKIMLEEKGLTAPDGFLDPPHRSW